MSRLAKKAIAIPAGVTVSREGSELVVKGPKGEERVRLLPFTEVKLESEAVAVAKQGEDKQARANAGTLWSHITNAVTGVTTGFAKILEIEGVGYRATVEGKTLVLSLGYVNPVRFSVPERIAVSVEKNTIAISGTSKELVGQVAAEIRAFKKPEPYKGKGIRYQGEVIRRKVGKKAIAAAGS